MLHLWWFPKYYATYAVCADSKEHAEAKLRAYVKDHDLPYSGDPADYEYAAPSENVAYIPTE